MAPSISGPSSPAPPQTRSSVPVQTRAVVLRDGGGAPLGPGAGAAGGGRTPDTSLQVLLAGSSAPRWPRRQINGRPSSTTVAAYPSSPLQGLGTSATRRQRLVAGSKAAAAGSWITLSIGQHRPKPPHTIISRPVHTASYCVRPPIGAAGSVRHRFVAGS